MSHTDNVDLQVAKGFGDEWTRFDQSDLGAQDRQRIFEEYFEIFPWSQLAANAVGGDFGCGSGRWAVLVAPRVGFLYCVDASAQALQVAQRNVSALGNCKCIEASVGNMPIEDGALDFGYSLGVLHHVPDTAAGLASCVKKLKRGAPFLVYLYYRFDNRSRWYRWLWQCSDYARCAISRLPSLPRYTISQIIAVGVYWPLARLACIAEKAGLSVEAFPLAYYRNRPFYVMRTDALDRFGTRLEQRFTREEVRTMMEAAGLGEIRFREGAPYWCAVGVKG
jgi:SAM-dependent methyltransferase